jgi:hypothetical protein
MNPLISKLSILFFMVLLAVSCSSIRKSSYFLNQNQFDTLTFGCSSSTSTKPPSFYKRFNILISSFYEIIDSLAISLNGDTYIDTIIIVAPNVSDKQVSCMDFKRLLVEVLNDKRRGRIRKVYSNLITDVEGVLSSYNGIYKTTNGFKIVHQAGARYGWEYSVEFSTQGAMLKLVEVHKKCSYDDRFLDVHTHYKNVSVDEINVPDTLKNQCNCDLFWSMLSDSIHLNERKD